MLWGVKIKYMCSKCHRFVDEDKRFFVIGNKIICKECDEKKRLEFLEQYRKLYEKECV